MAGAVGVSEGTAVANGVCFKVSVGVGDGVEVDVTYGVRMALDDSAISEFFAAVHDGPPAQNDEFLGAPAPSAPAPLKAPKARNVMQ